MELECFKLKMHTYRVITNPDGQSVQRAMRISERGPIFTALVGRPFRSRSMGNVGL